MKSSSKRAVFMLTPLLIMGLAGGFAWGQRAGDAAGAGEKRFRAHAVRGEHGERYGKRRQSRGGHRYMSRMVEELGLNDEQVKAIKGVLIEAHKRNIELRADARIAHIELGQLITGDEVNRASVSAKIAQITSVQGDIMRQRADAVLAVREILTPEQQAKAEHMLQRLLNGPGRYRGR